MGAQAVATSRHRIAAPPRSALRDGAPLATTMTPCRRTAWLGLVAAAALAAPVGAQNDFACCAASATMTYGNCFSVVDGIESWADFTKCWQRAKEHFSNTTRDQNNLTIADRYQIFSFVLSVPKSSSSSPARLSGDPPPKGVLSLDEAVMPPDDYMRLHGNLPFIITIDFPTERANASACANFVLDGLDMEFVSGLARVQSPMQVRFSGCGASRSKLHNFHLRSLGWASPQFSFVQIEKSEIVSVEPSAERTSSYAEALCMMEVLVEHSTVKYFGSIDLDIGGTVGLPQNGVRIVESSLLALDPATVLPGYRPAAQVDAYEVTFVGSFPDGPPNETWPTTFVQMENALIEYIGDLQVGTVHAINGTFRPWLHASSPTWARDDPPLVSVYRADGDKRGFGSKFSQCVLEYAWGADIKLSAISDSLIKWVPPPADVSIPASWDNHSWAALTFDLRTQDPSNAFPQPLFGCLICSRPTLRNTGRTIPAENVTVSNGTDAPFTRFRTADEKGTCTLAAEADAVMSATRFVFV
eukprot:NODE_232_length_1777_cov_157.003484.p1 GENE.NODE_232_length_1777_cov_157.003484~~NODE_232_length_1777_cov_157.003484.p1  ORF type:complete len:528 (+),score=118.75 NODE_232_length_1777_cov_157.003484:3-1586(+)